MNTNTSTWLHGLLAAIIGGGASAVTAGITLPAISPGAFNFQGQVWSLLEAMLAMFVVNGLIAAFAYLKQSPLPVESVQVTATKTETVTVTPKEGGN